MKQVEMLSQEIKEQTMEETAEAEKVEETPPCPTYREFAQDLLE